MTKNFIISRNPELFVKTVERDYSEMLSGTVSEKDAYDYVSNVLVQARACNNNPHCWFWLCDEPENMPSDCRVAFVYEPTYMMTSLIMNAMVKYESVKKIPNIEKVLKNVLNGCMGRGFMGHGFDSKEGFLNAMKIFAKGNVSEFLLKYGEVFSEFKLFFESKVVFLKDKLLTGKEKSDFGNCDYINEAKQILRMLNTDTKKIKVFVYGTLMRGQRANHYFDGAEYLGIFRLADYAMYDLGSYPGIKPCVGESVIGEIYEISEEVLVNLDSYEGEGKLYIRETVEVSNEDLCEKAFVYVYNHEISGKPMRESWGCALSDRVWYACYGSNLSSKRFACYIHGGYCEENGKTYSGCDDDSHWTDSKLRNYQGEMYYGNTSSSWENKGVSFFDPNAESKAVMRLYEVSREQFQSIQQQEGLNENWYGRMVCLGIIENKPVYTITSENRRPENLPSANYSNLLFRALIEECGVSAEDTISYLESYNR